MMDPKARPSTAPAAASSIPTYLLDKQEGTLHRAARPAKENLGRPRSRRSPNIAEVQEMIPGYHKLSLDIIRSMTAGKCAVGPT